MTRSVRSVLAATLAVALLSATVLAHMKLVKSLPAAGAALGVAPARVQIWFSETPDKAVSKLVLTGPSGPVKLAALTVDADHSMSASVEGTVGDGAYTVDWQAAGDDGHVQKGSFAFSVRRTR